MALHASGTLTAEDYDRLIAEIEAKLQRHEETGIFADMTGFDDMTAAAIGKDISYGFSKLGEWKRFSRNALVTDKRWMKLFAKTIAPLMPHIEVKTVDPSEREAALAGLWNDTHWCAGVTVICTSGLRPG